MTYDVGRPVPVAGTDHSFRGVRPTVARRYVWSNKLVREEAKARQRAVKYTPTMGCVAPGEKNMTLEGVALIEQLYA